MVTIPQGVFAFIISFFLFVGIVVLYRITCRYLTGLQKLFKGITLASFSICLRLFFTIAKTDYSIPYVLSFSNGLIVFTSVFLFIQISDFIFFDFLQTRYKTTKIPPLLHNIVLVIFYVAVTLFLFRTYLNFNITPLIATSAVFSMVIGLALQDILVNLFAGIIITLEKPFQINDWVSINNNIGQIAEITWRTTKIKTRSNDFIIIPNGTISKQEVINFSAPTMLHERKLSIGISYHEPPNKVKAILLEAIKKTHGILNNPSPTIHLESYKDFYVNYVMFFWIDDYNGLRKIEDELYTYVWYLLKRNKIEVPFPIRTIYSYPMTSEALKEKEENTHNEILSYLKQVEILKPLSEAELKELSVNLDFQKFAAGETLFHENDTSDSFYIIKSGEVEVSKLNKFGHYTTLAILSSGNYFGEMSLLTGEKRTATIKAIEDSEFIVINRDVFKKILVHNPSIVEHLSKILDKRYRENQAELSKVKDIVTEKDDIPPSISKLLKSIKVFFGLN